MRRLKIIALSLALTVAAAPLAARALNIAVPLTLIPDICFAGCVTWTHSQMLVEVQTLLAEIQNLKNINNIASAQGAVQQVIGIINAAAAAPPTQAGNVAATQVIATEQNTTTRIAAIDAEAQAANGTQQQAQVANLYASTIAGEMNKTNALLSEERSQQHAREDDAIATILEEAGPNSSAAPGSTL